MAEFIPDWQRCINCKVPARNGRITHRRTCPEFVRPRSGSVPGQLSLRGPALALADARARYDRFVSALTMRRTDRYDCPSCGARGDGHGLKVDLVGETVLFVCFACCPTRGPEYREAREQILAAVGMTWRDLLPPAEFGDDSWADGRWT
jgi:hypothetical protein